MRALYLEVLRMLLNTIACILLFAAGYNDDPQNPYLMILAIVMYLSQLIASAERRTTWNATKKKSDYREKFPKK